MEHRILICGFDNSANKEIAALLSKEVNAFVTDKNEFNEALQSGDKYKWLSTLMSMEEYYHQSIIILWFGTNDKKKRIQTPDNQRLVSYANEMIWQPYSNPKLWVPRTRVYFLNIGDRVRLSDMATVIKNYLGNENIPIFSASDSFIWTFPYPLMELVQN